MNPTLRIDVWSDILCPFCYIGKRRLESALARFEHAERVDVRWHSFQLDPDRPQGEQQPVNELLAEKYGVSVAEARAMNQRVTEMAAQEGLTYHLDSAVAVNTLDAHRLTHLASRHGLADAMHERLMKAYFTESEILDDHDTLFRLAVDVGLPGEEVRGVLNSDRYTDEVNADIRQAKQLGITAVPFFVLNNAYGVSGAQSVDAFLTALRTAHASAHATTA